MSKSSTQSRPAWSILIASLIILVLITSLVGTAVASAQALPGDLLYPVKRAQENIQLTLTPDSAGQARLRLEFADRRLEEAANLLSLNRSQAAGPVLADYNSLMQTELQYLGEGSSLTQAQRSGLASTLVDDMVRHQARLSTLTNQAPEEIQRNLQNALIASQAAYDQANDIIKSQKNNLNPTVPAAVPQASPTPVPATATHRPSPTPIEPTRTPSPSMGPNPTKPAASPSLPPSRTPAPTLPAIRIFPNPILPTRPPTLMPTHPPALVPTHTRPPANAVPGGGSARTPTPTRRFPSPFAWTTVRPWAFPLTKIR